MLTFCHTIEGTHNDDEEDKKEEYEGGSSDDEHSVNPGDEENKESQTNHNHAQNFESNSNTSQNNLRKNTSKVTPFYDEMEAKGQIDPTATLNFNSGNDQVSDKGKIQSLNMSNRKYVSKQ